MFDQRLYESQLKLFSTLNAPLAAKIHSLDPAPVSIPYDTLPELKTWYSGLNLSGIDILYIYGLGSGEIYEVIKPWLKDNSNHYAIFLEDDLQNLRQWLGSSKAKPLLNDIQVEIRDISNASVERRIIRLITEDNMFRPATITVLPAYQKTKFEDFVMLRDLITVETSEQNAMFKELANYGVEFYSNFYPNLMELPKAYDGQGLTNKFHNVPAIICGAGPSLNKHIPLLKKLSNKALIFAPSSALSVLTSQGVWPHFGVVMDPTVESFQQQYMQRGYEVPIIYQNRIYHETLTTIQGPRIFLPDDSFYLIEDWFEEQLNLEQLNFREGYTSVSVALSIARTLGCNPIILAGLDLSKSSTTHYSQGIDKHPLYPYTKNAKSELGNPITVKDIFGEEVTSYWLWILEAQWIDKFNRLNPTLTIINATEAGIGLFSVPNQTLAEVAETYLKKTYDLDVLVHQAIQEAALLPITVPQVRDHLEIFFQSLQRCLDLCKKIEKALTNASEQQSKLEKILKKEVGYQFLLIQLEKFFLTFIQKELRNLSRIRHAKEKTRKKQHLDHLLYNYLIQALDINLKMIATTLSQNQLSENIPARKEQPLTVEENDSTKIYYYPSGALYSVQTFKDELREGKHLYYYPQGTLKSEIHYKQGLLDGPTRLYYPSGQLKRELFFQNSLREGKETSWYENGQKFTEVDYKNNVSEHAQCWYPDGTLAKNI